ncbi:AAA family ATPase [Cohnella cellulosilytica]
MPIGVDDFKAVHERNLYYVDKSMLIKDILDDGAEVNLIARPRRFGKTLNLSMLRYFSRKRKRIMPHFFRIWRYGSKESDTRRNRASTR